MKFLDNMNKSLLIALSLSCALILWMLSGVIFNNDTPSTDKAQPMKESALLSVRVSQRQAQPVEREIIIYGRTAAARTVNLRAETDGRIVAIGIQRGAFIKKRDRIAQIDLRGRQGRLVQAEALLNQRELEYQAARDLADKGYQAENKLAEAEALLKEAKANVEILHIDIDYTQITAPFDGILHERSVEIGDYVQAGDSVATILELDPLIITGEVTEREVKKLHVGQHGKATLATDETVEGKIRYIAAASSEGTRTFTVELEISNTQSRIPSGITSEIIIPTETALAHLISPALLSLNDAGVLGLKIVNAEDVVEFIATSIVKTEDDGIWLTNLPRTARIITVGQGFARHGDRVHVASEEIVDTPNESTAGAPAVSKLPGDR